MTDIVNIITVNTSVIKTLVDSISNILVFCSFRFTEKGIEMAAINPTSVAILKLNLDAEGFESYEIQRPIDVGVNVIKLSKVLRTVKANEILRFSVKESDPSVLCITITNNEKETTTTYKLNMAEVDTFDYKVDVSRYSTIVSMSSSELLTILRNLNSITDMIEITVSGDTSISFSGRGDQVSRETVLRSGTNSKSLTKIVSPDTIVHGVYDISFFTSFARCSGLDETVELFIDSQLPMMITYRCAKLGTISMLLSDVVNRRPALS